MSFDLHQALVNNDLKTFLRNELTNHPSTAPGRIINYLLQYDRKDGLTPHSCELIVYKNDLGEFLKDVALGLVGGAGVKVILDEYVAPKPVECSWSFDLDDTHCDYEKLTDLQREFLSYHGEEIVYVTDSLTEGTTVFDHSITDSWECFISLLESDGEAHVELSELRPNGSTNTKGLVASGPIGNGKDNDTSSFWAIYHYIAIYLNSPTLKNFLNLLGCVSATIARGGKNKTSIVTTSMRWDHPNFEEYLDVSMFELLGSHQKGVSLTPQVLDYPELCEKIIGKVNNESLFLGKDQRDGTHFNVCVSGETVVDTSEGCFTVENLVGKPFEACINGDFYPSTVSGFWSNGVKPVVKLTLESGDFLVATPDHKVKVLTSSTHPEWVEIQKLKNFDLVALNSFYRDIHHASPVKSIEPAGEEEVFDCTILDIHCFSANRIITHNCMGISLKDRATCLIWRVNAGQCLNFATLYTAFQDSIESLVKLHIQWREQVGERANKYLSLDEDNQVALDVMGLANQLALLGFTYKEFTEALKEVNSNPDGYRINSTSSNFNNPHELARAYVICYQEATAQADILMQQKGLKPLARIFTIEPSQRHSFDCKDAAGNTLARSIFPPFARVTERSSDHLETQIVNYGGVEIATDVTPEVCEEFLEQWQVMMNATGRAHAISRDLWKPIDMDWFRYFILESPLKTVYYQFADDYAKHEYLDKDVSDDFEALAELDLSICPIDKKDGCQVCGA